MKTRSKDSIKEVIVHCSATPPRRDVNVDDIRRWHKGRGWSDIGYHFVITRSGLVQNGRPIKFVGAHCKGRNRRSIGVCLVGGVSASGKPEANFTFAQYASLLELFHEIDFRMDRHLPVKGHRDFAKKACPSFDIHALLKAR